ncbi:hypothetical protein M8C21_033336, partial [Ambrosia artemisiifolia]
NFSIKRDKNDFKAFFSGDSLSDGRSVTLFRAHTQQRRSKPTHKGSDGEIDNRSAVTPYMVATSSSLHHISSGGVAYMMLAMDLHEIDPLLIKECRRGKQKDLGHTKKPILTLLSCQWKKQQCDSTGWHGHPAEKRDLHNIDHGKKKPTQLQQYQLPAKYCMLRCLFPCTAAAQIASDYVLLGPLLNAH